MKLAEAKRILRGNPLRDFPTAEAAANKILQTKSAPASLQRDAQRTLADIREMRKRGDVREMPHDMRP